MMAPGSHLRQIGWAVVFAVCLGIFAALTFRVNAVKSEVRLAERAIIALEREKLILETEFQARASQQQLADWNRIDYGYVAPAAAQYLDNERQLAEFGMERAETAPDPIRVAQAPSAEEATGIMAMVSPLTGEPVDDGQEGDEAEPPRAEMSARRSLVERLDGAGSVSGQSASAIE